MSCHSSLENEIRVQSGKNGEISLHGLTKLPINTFDEFKELFVRANDQRSVSSTKLNSESSRSHRSEQMMKKILNVTSSKRFLTFSGHLFFSNIFKKCQFLTFAFLHHPRFFGIVLLVSWSYTLSYSIAPFWSGWGIKDI